ncbi:MAG: IS30 family transposase [Thermoleophilia bacterium]|nr:IS30 family transposase [Thermoleophilia bacterium]
MVRQRRRRYTQAERKDLWERWKRGESAAAIARALDRKHGSVHIELKKNGGIPPRERHRSRLALTLDEREEISRGIASGESIRGLARQLGRAPSTVSREISRNLGRVSYRAGAADQRASARARRPQDCKLRLNSKLRRLVAGKLEKDWSSEQIAGFLKDSFPNDQTMQVSHETIYLTLFIQTRGALKRELISHLRRARAMRRPKGTKKTNTGQGQIVGAVSISERPAEAEDRAVPGHWEGDLLAGKANTHIATLVERHSRFVMLVKLDGKDTETVIEALASQMVELPGELKESLTWDRGSEMAGHASFTVATDLKVYICDPQSPWQRGSNENTNGLLRQYFPKGTDLSKFTQTELDRVALKLNTRPRKTLGFKTPAYTLERALR